MSICAGPWRIDLAEMNSTLEWNLLLLFLASRCSIVSTGLAVWESGNRFPLVQLISIRRRRSRDSAGGPEMALADGPAELDYLLLN